MFYQFICLLPSPYPKGADKGRTGLEMVEKGWVRKACIFR